MSDENADITEQQRSAAQKQALTNWLTGSSLAAPPCYPVLRCPFCGSTAKQPNDISPVPNAGNWWEVMCADDNKIGCNAWRSDETPELVVQKWNMRAYPWLGDASLTVATSIMAALGSRDAKKRLALAKAVADDIETVIRDNKKLSGGGPKT